MISTEMFFLSLFLFLAVVAVLLLVFYLRWRGRSSYQAKTVDDAIQKFQKDVEPFLRRLEPPHDCDDGTAALHQLRSRYARMLKVANRYPTDSAEHEQIFKQALNPVLDKIGEATTSRECFKNPRYKKAFDRFIRGAQRYADGASNSTDMGS